MPYPRILAATLLLFGTLGVADMDGIIDITLSPIDTPSCGQPPLTSDENAITISINDLTTYPSSANATGCLNLGDIPPLFHGDAANLTASCDDGRLCTFNYTISNAQVYDAATNYSQIFYKQAGSGDGQVGQLYLYTYPQKGCRQVEDDALDLRFVSEWTCTEEDVGSCDTLPYPVQSIEIKPVEPAGDDNRPDHCVVAAEVLNAGFRERAVSSMALSAVLFVFAVMVGF